MIYPVKKEVFTAFRLTPFYKIKVVILGQDPYYQPNQAHGLAFSVRKHTLIPPSLKNIYVELNSDFSTNHIFSHGCLESWACQGVFLLNTILTVEQGKPGSHANIGWEIFTDKVIRLINDYHTNIIFLLWGKKAHSKKNIIDCNRHYVFQTSHPSPLSVYQGFFGCRHFSKTNQILIDKHLSPINWFF